MLQKNINDLLVFLIVAKERSFTKAASKLGVSQSALSHTMRNLEEKLGVQLLTRTTRSVAPTKAGASLLKNIAPRLDEIAEELSKVVDLKKSPFGSVRLLTDEHAANFLVWPQLREFLRHYPEIRLDVNVESNAQTDPFEHYDAKICQSEVVYKNMLSFPVSKEMRMAVVASPYYLKERSIPQTPYDLLNHQCINANLPIESCGADWIFEIEQRRVVIHMEGQFVCNTLTQALQAVVDGFGFAYIPEKEVQNALRQKHLVQVLEDYCPVFPGYNLYYPNRRHYTQAFTLFLKAFQEIGLK